MPRRRLNNLKHIEKHFHALTVNPQFIHVNNGTRGTLASGWINAFWEVSIIMKKGFGISLSCIITFLIASNSIGSVSVEEAIQNLIEMFKSSGKNIKALNKSIQTGDTSKAVQLMGFHVTWSEKCPYFFL